jgi:hypothetical protein
VVFGVAGVFWGWREGGRRRGRALAAVRAAPAYGVVVMRGEDWGQKVVFG